jgi:hypothetical protein
MRESRSWRSSSGVTARSMSAEKKVRRLIDELMGHEASGLCQHRGSAMGAHYRHTTGNGRPSR